MSNNEVKGHKFGIGTLSLILALLGLLFSFSFGLNVSVGDSLITLLGLRAWSNGNKGLHYTIFYTLIFFIPALYISYKFKDDMGSRLGGIISILYIVFILFNVPLLINY